MMSDNSEEDRDLRNECARVIKAITPHVKSAESSLILESSYTLAHMNIRTKEDMILCVRLTVCGFEVVGKQFDTADDKPETCYEMIDQLLNDISPAYCQSFGESLSEKLAALVAQGVDQTRDS